MEILIWGAGGIGTALALVLSRLGHKVTLVTRNLEDAQRWRAQGYSDRHAWEHQFPKSLRVVSVDEMGDQRFPVVVIATTVDGLSVLPVLPLTRDGCIVLVQKGLLENGLSPIQYIKRVYPGHHCLTCTGAAFAEEVAAGAEVQLMIASEKMRPARAFGNLFAGSAVWPIYSNAVEDMSLLNTLRTILSLQLGIVAGYGISCSSTNATIRSELLREACIIATRIGVTKQSLNPTSRVWSTWLADIELCDKVGSRNYLLGLEIGQGIDTETAMCEILGKHGVMESVRNMEVVARMVDKWGDDLPWFTMNHQVVKGRLTPSDAAQLIRNRQAARFA